MKPLLEILFYKRMIVLQFPLIIFIQCQSSFLETPIAGKKLQTLSLWTFFLSQLDVPT